MRLSLLLASLSIIIPLAATASAGERVNPIGHPNGGTGCAQIYTFAAGPTPCIPTVKPEMLKFPRSPMDPDPGIVPHGAYVPRMGGMPSGMGGTPMGSGNPCSGRNLCAYVEKPAGISGSPTAVAR